MSGWLDMWRAPSNAREYGCYSAADIASMHSLAAALAVRRPTSMLWVIRVLVLTLLALLVWMAMAQLDTLTRGVGKVIPSGQVQKLQSLEGGVVAEILVSEGQRVEAGQALMKISDRPFVGSYEEGRVHYLSLRARAARLLAEAEGEAFVLDAEVESSRPDLQAAEIRQLQSDRSELQQSQSILSEQLKQAESQLTEAEARKRQLQRNLDLVRREIQLKRPLVSRQVLSEVDLIQLQVREAEAAGELESLGLSMPRLRSLIDEAGRKHDHLDVEFRSKARQQLNEVQAELARVSETQLSLADRVERTTLRSTVPGVIKRIHANTIGGVIRPGMDVIELVPEDEQLLIEAHVRPSDIAHLVVGQNARIRFSAYDFALYGSMPATLSFISADTITDEQGQTFFVVRLQPRDTALQFGLQHLPIRVGMTADVDIMTGKRTILEYLLKPVNRALSNGMRES